MENFGESPLKFSESESSLIHIHPNVLLSFFQHDFSQDLETMVHVVFQ